jgi:hypothetical protein
MLRLADIKTADWSEEVAPFWGEVIKTAFTAEGISGLLKAGWTTIKGALVSGGVGRQEGCGGRACGGCRAHPVCPAVLALLLLAPPGSSRQHCPDVCCCLVQQRALPCPSSTTLPACLPATSPRPASLPPHPACRVTPSCLQVMPLMAQGFQMGLVKFVLITGRKQ